MGKKLMRQIGARWSAPRPDAVRGRGGTFGRMDRRLFDDLGRRIEEALRNSPAQDLQKNLRALLAGWFDRMDLVLREDFEVQKKLLDDALARLAALEARLAELESRKRAP
jgi:BMFP domain-containing protein YqiC